MLRHKVAHVQLTAHQYPTGSFQQSSFPNSQSLACTSVQGIIPSLVQDFAFVLVKFDQAALVPLSHSSALLRSLWVAALPSGLLTAPLILFSSPHLRRTCCNTSAGSSITMQSRTGPGTNHLWLPYRQSMARWSTVLWAQLLFIIPLLFEIKLNLEYLQVCHLHA